MRFCRKNKDGVKEWGTSDEDKTGVEKERSNNVITKIVQGN